MTKEHACTVRYPLPVLGFSAVSGTGKTTLLKRVIPLLRERGLRVGLVKHAHHDVEPDVPGKDSYELRKAGASQVLLASHRRWALFAELETAREPDLESMLGRLDPTLLDLVLVEGFKQAAIPKIELYRPSLGVPPRYPDDPCTVAVVSDGDLPVPTGLPRLDLNAPAEVAGFVVRWYTTQGFTPAG